MTGKKRVSPKARVAGVVVIIAALLWVSLVTYYYRAFQQSPEEIAELLDATPMPIFMILPFKTMWFSARAGSIEEGQLVPDFTLKKQDGSGTVTLSAYRGEKPVVLVFGSYT